MINWNTALVTGASSGIGLSFVKHLADSCNNLLITSRDKIKLEQIKQDLEHEHKIKVFVIECDLTLLESVSGIMKFIEENDVIPDLFINNAGIGVYGNFTETDSDKELKIMNLNIVNSTLLIKEIIELMKRNIGGTILNVSSTMAFRKSPNWSVYSASKAYILSLSKSLAMEYEKSNINISVLCPGKTDTEFDLHSGKNMNSTGLKLSPDAVVNYTLKKLKGGKGLIIPGFINKLKYWLFKIFPDFITDRIVNSL